ncbi:hypothetical protein [Aromatoleum evansii]|uniref:Uncharacterized protein n=1 Tax=Aromatoleum evansii TaxID=59406 RepID=A0ABZ1ALN1_AROEV|nr:hypothetical protein [Aromatoleum evansii]NMG32111.1 hypothetical protein [Aromatoleum evansii]WRL46673.1 hypothetical protein U5817_01110 [Aromatoleum evansii]
MKWLARLLAVALVALAAWWLAPRFAAFDTSSLLLRDGNGWKLEMVPQATIAATYLAERERWLSFPVPAGADRVRIVSNANLYDLAKAREARTADPRRRWRYALDIEITDGEGAVLLGRRHHHRTDLAELRLPDERIVTPSFYLDETLSPVTGVVVMLNLGGLPQAARLRIRLADGDPDIADVAVRAYFPEAASERQLDHLWQRLSERQKSSLAKGSVYAHELLTEAERRNLLHNQWQPAGPQGARGVDFRGRDLYVLRDVEGEPVDDPVPPAGLVAAPGRPVVFPLPEGGGKVEFEAIPLAADGDSTGEPGTPRLAGRWHAGDSLLKEDVAIPLAAAEGAMPLRGERRFGGGLVELEANRPLAVRAFMDIAGARTEITPERLFQRLFVAHSAQPVSFTIAHADGAATPVRVEARHLQTAANPAAAPLLHYAFTAADGSVLREGEVPLIADGSRYDEPLGALRGSVVSEPTELFFSVPPQATALRLGTAAKSASRSPVLVGVSTRPAQLPRQIRAPEDRYDFDAKGLRVPAWFPILPQDYERLIAGNGSQLVAVQPRPPRERPELQSGRFTYEDFRPGGRWLARQLLTPREAGSAVREEALPSTFSPLAAGRAQRLDFPAWMGLRQVSPALLWISPDDTPFSATVMLDGRPHHAFGGRGRYGETRLPPLPAGAHTLKVEFASNNASNSAGDGTRGATRRPRLFINHATPAADAYSLRLAARVEREVAFEVERNTRDEEILSARLFQPAGWQGRSRISARIEGPAPAALTPLPGWLFDDRRYDVRPDPSWSAPVFDTQGERSDAGQPVQIVIPAGAAPGRYRVVFRIEEGPPGYLALSRIRPGVEARRRIFEEAEVRHVAVE